MLHHLVYLLPELRTLAAERNLADHRTVLTLPIAWRTLLFGQPHTVALV